MAARNHLRSTTRDIEVVVRFIQFIRDHVNTLGCRPRRGYADDWVLLALVSKANWVARATCLLVRAGYAEEAFGLTRTLTDIFFTTRYICNRDSDSRARMFINYSAKEQQIWLKIRSQYYPKMTLRPRPDQARLTALASQFKDPHRWSGHPTRHLADEADTVERDATGRPLKYTFDYEVVYGWTSRYVHPTASALDSHVGYADVPFGIAPKEIAGNSEGDSALFNAALYLSRVCIYVFRKLGTGLPSQVDRRIKRLLERLRISAIRSRNVRLRSARKVRRAWS